MGREKKRNIRKHITKEKLFDILKAGILFPVKITGPNMLLYDTSYTTGDSEWGTYYPSSISRETTKLWRKGFVEVKETEDGHRVELTKRGKKEILQFDIDALSIPSQDPWDGKWRMVFFDIPAGEKVRHRFREQLLAMGFFRMQASVYVHPFPCKPQVQFLREVLFVPHEVKIATVEHLENDEDLRDIPLIDRPERVNGKVL